MDKIIPVTKPFLPPKEEYQQYLDQIWNRNWLTNNGPLVKKLESNLRTYLNCEHLLYLSNGTIALQIAIKALKLQGDIITTPFSYVATTSSIVWESCNPLFVDIDSDTLNIDPKKIEQSITSRTSAIVATHVYGNPCDVDAIEIIAKKHNLKVIYDAAHAFGVTYKNKSIFQYGDISTASFHATKLFHTIEGGAVITNHSALSEKMNRLRNFGHLGQEDFQGIGINGKNSEFHAAMGLCNLKYINSILENRKKLSSIYDGYLEGLELQRQKLVDPLHYNYSYYPIIFENEATLNRVKNRLESENILPRRYFYPDLSTLNYVEAISDLKNTKFISPRILCLPLYFELTEEEIQHICTIISNNI